MPSLQSKMVHSIWPPLGNFVSFPPHSVACIDPAWEIISVPLGASNRLVSDWDRSTGCGFFSPQGWLFMMCFFTRDIEHFCFTSPAIAYGLRYIAKVTTNYFKSIWKLGIESKEHRREIWKASCSTQQIQDFPCMVFKRGTAGSPSNVHEQNARFCYLY